MQVQLRSPNTIMKLSRLGSFHQSKLSFLRSFLDEFKDWEFKRDLFDLGEYGYGTAIYSFKNEGSGFINTFKDYQECDDYLTLHFSHLDPTLNNVFKPNNPVAQGLDGRRLRCCRI